MTPEAERLLHILRDAYPHREVYRAKNESGWYVTYGGGKFTYSVVLELIDEGYITSVYSDCPFEMYHVGRTIDVVRTMEERRKYKRKDAPLIYVGDL